MIKDEYFLEMCNTIAKSSKCLSRKIGAILVKDDVIISTGKNGPPRHVPHCDERHWYDQKLNDVLIENNQIVNMSLSACQSTKIRIAKCPRQLLGYGSGRGLQWCVAGHAERNALINAARIGVSTIGTKMFMNCGISCTPCLVEIINAGVEEIIVTKLSYYDLSGEYLIKNSNLKVRLFDCVEEGE